MAAEANFSTEVSRWIDQVAKARARAFFHALAWAAVNRVSELTPVDTGFLRSNWTAIRPEDTEPKSGAVPFPQLAIERLQIGERIRIINPTEYARRIEYGFVGEDSQGRHFNQQGRHMAQQTVTELPAIAAELVQRFR